MATMCFKKAGDGYREKWARAAGLFSTAERVISTNLEMGQASLQKASEIYESIGMHEKAATCYVKLRDYERAGMLMFHVFLIQPIYKCQATLKDQIQKICGFEKFTTSIFFYVIVFPNILY